MKGVAMAKVRKKSIMGVDLESTDGLTWKWRCGQRRFCWSGSGHCYQFDGESEQGTLLIFSVRIEGAVGYTAGWVDGFARGHSTAVDQLRPKQEGPPIAPVT